MPSRLSLEYVRIPVSETDAGTPVDPTGDGVTMAIVDLDALPASGDFKGALWETGADGIHYARLLVGPGSGTFDFSTITEPTYKDVYVKITATPESPVIYAGRLLFS